MFEDIALLQAMVIGLSVLVLVIGIFSASYGDRAAKKVFNKSVRTVLRDMIARRNIIENERQMEDITFCVYLLAQNCLPEDQMDGWLASGSTKQTDIVTVLTGRDTGGDQGNS